MFLRPTSEQTLAELQETISLANTATMTLTPDDVEVNVSERTLRLRDDEVHFDSKSYQPIAKWLDVPYKFLERQDAEFQQVILDRLLARAKGEMTFEYVEHGILDIRSPNVSVIDPRRIVGVASEVISPEAQVIEVHHTSEWLQFDAIVPENFDQGWGGDPKVGDITGGGLRFTQDRKRNLAPSVSSFFYRLACTNGYETYDERHKIDARNLTTDGILQDLEAKARVAFGSIEADIAALYELREQPVPNPSQAILRLGDEAGLPARMNNAMAKRVSEVIEDPTQATMFDVINLMTNQANEPGIASRLRVRRTLERAGGAQVSEHISRCRSCSSKLN